MQSDHGKRCWRFFTGMLIAAGMYAQNPRTPSHEAQVRQAGQADVGQTVRESQRTNAGPVFTVDGPDSILLEPVTINRSNWWWLLIMLPIWVWGLWPTKRKP